MDAGVNRPRYSQVGLGQLFVKVIEPAQCPVTSPAGAIVVPRLLLSVGAGVGAGAAGCWAHPLIRTAQIIANAKIIKLIFDFSA